MTVSELCKEYIDSKTGIIKDSTVANYKTMDRITITPIIGSKNAVSLTKEDVSEFYKSLVFKGYSENHIHRIGVFLRSVYNYASREYDIDNVCKNVFIPKLRKKMITVLTEEEKAKVLNYGCPAVIIALSMGLRIGEVSGLMGQDIEDNVLTINRTVQRIQDGNGSTKVIVTKPKTEHSHRQIPIPKHIIPLLESDSDRYIIGNGTKPTEPRALQYQWKRFCKEHGMRDINFHTLRHTFATSALEAGIDVKTLSEMLGHASTSITMDLYCHPTLKHKKNCMDKLWGGKP